jgi:hypothetical protein
MANLFKVLVFVVVLLFSQPNELFAENTANPWQDFINKPNSENYEKCSLMIHDSLTGPYEENDYGEKINTPTQNSLISNYEIYNRFLKLVREINPYAIKLAFQLYPLTDGAASEDLFGQIGMMVKEQPEFFLKMIKKYRITNPSIIDGMVSGHPVDEFVDDLDKTMSEIAERIQALQTVRNSELTTLRDQCTSILQKDLERYKQIKQG